MYFFPPFFLRNFLSEIGGIGWGFCGVPTLLEGRFFPPMSVQSPGLEKKNHLVLACHILEFLHLHYCTSFRWKIIHLHQLNCIKGVLQINIVILKSLF